MLQYNEIKPGRYVVFNNEPVEVISSHVFRKQQRKPVNQVKMRSLITGKVYENSFGSSEKAEEAELERKAAVFIYESKGEFWFHEVGDKSKRFSLDSDSVGDKHKFLKANTEVDMLVFDEKIIGIKIPIKMEFKVTEAPPDVRGNTAQGGNKLVTIETGASITVPMFIKTGDVLRINTDTGEYVERV